MPRFLLRSFSPAVTDISRINIVENGKKSAGCGSRRQGPRTRLSASAKHSSCQNIAMHLILGAEGVGRGQRGASTRSYWFLAPHFVHLLSGPFVHALVKLGSSCARPRDDVSAWTPCPSSTSARISAVTSRLEGRARRATEGKRGTYSFSGIMVKGISWMWNETGHFKT